VIFKASFPLQQPTKQSYQPYMYVPVSDLYCTYVTLYRLFSSTCVTICTLVGFNRYLHWSYFGLFIFVCFIQSICWAWYFQWESPLLYLSLENVC